MSMQDIATLIAVILSVLAAAGSAVAWLWNRPAANASTLRTLHELARDLSQRVSELERERAADRIRIRKLEAEGSRMERLLTICIVGLHALTNQLLRQNLQPDWLPPVELDDWILNHQKENES